MLKKNPLTVGRLNLYSQFKSLVLFSSRYFLGNFKPKLSSEQNHHINNLRNDGFVLIENFLDEKTLTTLQKEFEDSLHHLNFDTPCLAQSQIDPIKHKLLISNFLLGSDAELEKAGVMFRKDDAISYQQVIDDFKPSTLTTQMLEYSECYRKIWLDPYILGIVSSYLGLIPHLSEAYVRRNFPASYKTMNHYWHRDLNSSHLLKVFVFLSDCNEKNGPHEYISGTHKQYEILNGKRYFHDEEVDKLFPLGHPRRKTSIVKAGSVIIEDTRGVHRAKLPENGWRDLGYMVFMPLRPFYPYQNFKFPIKAYNRLNSLQKMFIHKNAKAPGK